MTVQKHSPMKAQTVVGFIEYNSSNKSCNVQHHDMMLFVIPHPYEARTSISQPDLPYKGNSSIGGYDEFHNAYISFYRCYTRRNEI